MEAQNVLSRFANRSISTIPDIATPRVLLKVDSPGLLASFCRSEKEKINRSTLILPRFGVESWERVSRHILGFSNTLTRRGEDTQQPL
jgi:hypothetical protein